MPDYLQFIQDIVTINDENAHFLIICNTEGKIEYFKGFNNPYIDYTKKFTGSLTGKYLLDVYSNLTEENSMVMQTLRTGKPVVAAPQQLAVDESVTISTVSTTIPILVDNEMIGVIVYAQCYGISQNEVPLHINELATLNNIITQDKKMQALKETVQRVSWSDSPVLIYGETGTGKELIAESIHTAGRRINKPFLSQNCAAVPANLLEGIFFGTEKGSFTGAETKKGLFEMADGGTLFLDEMNSMSIDLQIKLLRAIEEKKVRHVGGSKEIRFNTRIVCATNEAPDVLIKEKRLRKDLYYRIGVIQIEIPPLRERRGDIPLLTAHFIDVFNRQMNRQIKGLSEMAARIFQTAQWPGNIRQLRNVVESAFNMTQENVITIKDIPDVLHSGDVFFESKTASSTWNDIRSVMERSQIPVPPDSPAASGASAVSAISGASGASAASSIPGASGVSAASIAPGCPDFTASRVSPVPSVFPDQGASGGRAFGHAFLSEEELDAMLNQGGINLQEMLDDFEAYLIAHVISREEQLNRAAKKLSISPQRLQYKLHRLNLKRPK